MTPDRPTLPLSVVGFTALPPPDPVTLAKSVKAWEDADPQSRSIFPRPQAPTPGLAPRIGASHSWPWGLKPVIRVSAVWRQEPAQPWGG